MRSAVEVAYHAYRSPHRVDATDRVIERRTITARIGYWRQWAERQSVRPPISRRKVPTIILGGHRLFLYVLIIYERNVLK